MDIIKRFEGNIELRQLEVGDYACSQGCCGWERKEQDIYNLQRTLMQVTELKRAYKNAYLVVNISEDTFSKSTRVNKFAKIGFMASLNAQHITPLFITNYYRMLHIMHRTILKNHDGKRRDYGSFNHVRHITVKDSKLNVLTSLPGVGQDKAKLILKTFGNLYSFFNATPEEIQKLPGFGPKSTKKIIDCLYSKRN